MGGADGGGAHDGGANDGGAAQCGDGVVSGSEQCDDGNNVAFDGCEPVTCTFTCTSDAMCTDGEPCNGTETCDPSTHACAAGTPLEDGAACMFGDVTDGNCRGEACVSASCGNLVVAGDEECDDGNGSDGDGCDNDCTFSCTSDADCDDALFCTGVETCDTTSHVCASGEPPTCSDDDDCTTDACDPDTDSCTNALIDEDGDGHSPMSAGACGDDCDDGNPTVFTGAEEACDDVDNNCDMAVDEIAPTWYIDCDADGYAASTDSSRAGCTAPAASAAGCGGSLPGGWTDRRPINAVTTDCNDANANMHPGQAMYFTTPAACTAPVTPPLCESSSCPTGDDRFANYNCNCNVDRDHSTNAGFNGVCTVLVRGCDREGECEFACGGSGWMSATTPACGFLANYASCGGVRPDVCRGDTAADCPGFTQVCLEEDPRRCEDCARGIFRGCRYAYVRCGAATVTFTQMGCR